MSLKILNEKPVENFHQKKKLRSYLKVFAVKIPLQHYADEKVLVQISIIGGVKISWRQVKKGSRETQKEKPIVLKLLH